MTLPEVILLAVIQGATEFLPVSSSGHLVAARVLLGVADTDGLVFDAFLHLGTLLAVLVYYRVVWWGIIRAAVAKDAEGSDKRELLAKLAVATVPGAVVGYLWQDAIGDFFRSPAAVAVAFAVTAGVLLLADYVARRAAEKARASWRDATLIGLAQAVALVPGISRSGITMAAGRARGLSRAQAASFSFLLSAPIIAGAGLSNVSALVDGTSFTPLQLGVGLLVSFVSGLAAISFVLRVVERTSFTPFAAYLLLLAGVLWLYA